MLPEKYSLCRQIKCIDKRQFVPAYFDNTAHSITPGLIEEEHFDHSFWRCESFAIPTGPITTGSLLATHNRAMWQSLTSPELDMT